MPAGYSATPLIRKLGIKPGTRLRFVNAPQRYDRLLGRLPEGAIVAPATRGTFDFIQLFARRRSELGRRLGPLKRALATDGVLWISWPKKTSAITGDLTREDVRAAGLKAGLVDVKVCAVDDDWSGLKFVYRLEDR